MTQFKQHFHNQLNHFIEENELFTSNDRLLVAVSGGVDSMVLLFALKKLNYNLAVVHCNFQLRDQESEDDEAFVRTFCLQNDIPFFVQRFETTEVATKQKISIQMAARELRYDWFQELANEHDFTHILTAHHADDQVETFLMHIIRGSGLKGLTGIAAKTENIVRPMLFAPKSEILVYAEKNKLEYRSDSSNESTKYQRNYVRHTVIPSLQTLNPNIQNTILEEINTFKGIYRFYQQGIQRLKTELIHLHETEDAFKISILELAGRNVDAPILFELLRDFEFNYDQTIAIFDALNEQSGKQFFSPTHTLLIDRTFLIIREKTIAHSVQRTIFEDDILFSTFQELTFKRLENVDISTILNEKNKKIAYFDYDSLAFPLTFRNWKEGDKMQPLGMKGNKKISDLLIDNKIDLQQKENTFVLAQGNQILWLCGIRQSEVGKINANTKQVLKVQLK